MTNTIRVLGPVGAIWTPAKPAAKRPSKLEGLRPGILENSKANAQRLMETLVGALAATVPLGQLAIGHKAVSLPPSRSTVEMLRKCCDFALVGSSD